MQRQRDDCEDGKTYIMSVCMLSMYLTFFFNFQLVYLTSMKKGQGQATTSVV